MKFDIADKSLMLILLLEECNYTCAHCVREDEPMDPGYKLSFGQLQSCLLDCRSLGSIRWVHFSGGEPTLWRERNRDLLDLLLTIAKAGFTPGFTTNGSFFVDHGRCHDFFAKYFDGSNMPLRVYLSIDTFHRNFNVKQGRSLSLDNIIRCKRELPRAKAELLNIKVSVTISRDVNSLLPDGMIHHYETLGVAFGFVPLLAMGKAKSFSHLCPDLSSDNPEDMGAYQRFHRTESRKKWVESENQYSTNHISLIGDDYYFADPLRNVAQLGHLPDTLIRAYSIAEGVG